MICLFFFFFFFSSRRRHTRYWRDWSSDVCSSDLRSSRRRTCGRESYIRGLIRGHMRGTTHLMSSVGSVLSFILMTWSERFVSPDGLHSFRVMFSARKLGSG